MNPIRVLARNPLYLGIVLALIVGAVTAIGLTTRSDDPGRPVVMREEPTLEVTESFSVSPSPSPTEEATPTPQVSSEPKPRGLDSPWGDRWITEPSMDRDGDVVAFTVAPEYGENYKVVGFFDIYVRSRATHSMSLISMSTTGGDANGDSRYPAVSADGSRIAFVSDASNLVPGDTNGAADVFVRDVRRHTTERISLSSTGTQGNGQSGPWKITTDGGGERWPGGVPAISADGRYVAFPSAASNLVSGDDNHVEDVFVHDLDSGETILVSATDAGVSGNGPSSHPSMSADGDLIAFETTATDLTDAQKQGRALGDVLVRDMHAGTTTLVSVSPDNVRFDGLNGVPAFSPSGSHVAFIHVPDFGQETYPIYSEGGDLYRRDLARGQTARVVSCDHCRRAALSETGSVIVYIDAIGGMDAFCVFTTEPDTAKRGTWLGASGPELDISWDGRFIAFAASIDALSDPTDEEKFGGPGGAMIYDRTTDTYTPAWKV